MTKPRLRIAVLHRNFSYSGGGAERYAISLVEQLASRHDIHVFAQAHDHEWPGVTYHRVAAIKRPRWLNQLWYATATWWLTKRGFDVVHSHENTWHGNVQTIHVLPVWHNLFAGRTGWALARRWLQALTSPRVWTYLGLEFGRFSVHKSRCIVLSSEALREVVVKTFPCTVDHLSVILPGVTLPVPTTTMDKQQARTALGVAPDARCVLLIGNDLGRKGLDALLHALVKLPPDVVVLAVGHADRIPKFQALAQTLGVAKRVIFQGAMRDIAQAYRAADVLAHPTLEDTFAMVVLEAMAYQLPVIVSGPRYCGIAQLLRDGDNALLLPDPHDAEALVEALQSLLSHDGLRQRLIASGYKFAQTHDWGDKALQQEEIYENLLKPPA